MPRVERALPGIDPGGAQVEGDHERRDRGRRERHHQRARQQARADAAEREARQRPVIPHVVLEHRRDLRARRGGVSSTTSPSRSVITRSAAEATLASWVTSSSVWPRSRAARSSPITSPGRRRVEVPGRLVGQHDVRAGRQRAGERDPLLFAARQLARGGLGLLA